MDLHTNTIKRALREGRPQIGLWSTLGSHIAAEVLAGSGFDWVLFDTEHAPNDLTLVHRQLQAMQGSTTSAVVRPAWNDAVLFKRLLDTGVQTLLVPFVQSADEARRAVAATRYPPRGIRGVATTIRANKYGRVKDYLHHADEEICVVVQIETRQAVEQIEAIAAIDGVDCLFIGPSDLAADLGHLGNNAHPDVRGVITSAIGRVRRTGKAAGILAPIEADARHWIELGCTFVGVGNDTGILARQTEALAARLKSDLGAERVESGRGTETQRITERK
jgi:4-hydroxy-2-oxoheptanedioate aldolase